MAYSSSVSSQGSRKYDLFLNFRGEDVRFNFLSYLIAAFNHASLNIFVDYKLRRGEDIESALMDAIQDSKVAVTIFSEGYASSSWTLDELVKIMECRENPMLRQNVIPVFYHVTASDVRNQSGVFSQDFAKHESDYGRSRKVRNWRAAMEAAGRLSGRSVKKTSPEFDAMVQIVNDVLEILERKTLEFPDKSSQKLRDSPKPVQFQPKGPIWSISSSHQGIYGQDLKTILVSIQYESEQPQILNMESRDSMFGSQAGGKCYIEELDEGNQIEASSSWSKPSSTSSTNGSQTSRRALPNRHARKREKKLLAQLQNLCSRPPWTPDNFFTTSSYYGTPYNFCTGQGMPMVTPPGTCCYYWTDGWNTYFYQMSSSSSSSPSLKSRSKAGSGEVR